MNTQVITPDRELLQELKISRATFYRYKQSGQLAGLLKKVIGVNHHQYLEGLEQWKSEGLYAKQWSKNYRNLVMRNLKHYFEEFNEINPENLEHWMREPSGNPYSQRKDKHAAVSIMAKYLHHKGMLQEKSIDKIKDLYPKKPLGYQPKQRIISTNELNKILSTIDQQRSQYQ